MPSPTAMIDERLQELAALHALDLLEGDERVAFEAELAARPELRALVEDLRHAGTALALARPSTTPPAELRARVLAALARSPAATRPNRAVSLRVLIPWALVAAFAICCAWLVQLYLASRTETALLRDQLALGELEVIGSRHQAEAERIIARRQAADDKRHLAQLDQQIDQTTRQIAEARRDYVEAGSRLINARLENTQLRRDLAAANELAASLRGQLGREVNLAQCTIATLTGSSPQARAIALWHPLAEEGVLRVVHLPALAADQDYQLWVTDSASPDPVDAGVLTVDPATGGTQATFKPRRPLTQPARFTVTLERKGGAPKPGGPVVLASE